MVIADENINSKIIKALMDSGVEVLSICEHYPGISDEDVIKLSTYPLRIIITEDKDFGEWVFAHGIKNISVILLRYHHKKLSEIISTLIPLLKNNPETLFGKFITITTKKIRIRKIDG